MATRCSFLVLCFCAACDMAPLVVLLCVLFWYSFAGLLRWMGVVTVVVIALVSGIACLVDVIA